MRDYNVRIEYVTRKNVDDHLLKVLSDYHPATSRSPEGRVEVWITLPADSLREATMAALNVGNEALNSGILGCSVMSSADALDEIVEEDGPLLDRIAGQD